MRVVMLMPYPAYPPHGGGVQRMYQLIRFLSQRHELWCLGLAPDAAAMEAAEPLREFCRLTLFLAPRRSLGRRAWTTLTSPVPDMALRAPSTALREALARVLRQESIDVVQACSIEMAQYALQGRGAGRVAALDNWNAEYLLQRRAALTDLRQPRRVHAGVYSLFQWAKLAAYERMLGRQLDCISVVSAEDAVSLRQIGVECPLPVVPNGVDTAFFRPQTGPVDPNLLLFSGTLDFRPNVDALRWFVDHVWPLIRQRRPATRLAIVGRSPTSAVESLEQDGIMLHANVPDVRPFFAQAAAYVLPMRIGGGVRLKLLEAFACGVPVVTTSMGADGVDGLRHGDHCLLADDPTLFADRTLHVLDDRATHSRLVANARELVTSRYDWSAIAPKLEQAWEEARNPS